MLNKLVKVQNVGILFESYFSQIALFWTYLNVLVEVLVSRKVGNFLYSCMTDGSARTNLLREVN